MTEIKDMVGLTMVEVEKGSGTMTLTSACGRKFVFFHEQDCCENVQIEDITGDLSDLVGSPLLLAEEVSGETPEECDLESYESVSWTFYKFATIKGYVDVRWIGTSNGYYSERVDFEEVVQPKP